MPELNFPYMNPTIPSALSRWGGTIGKQFPTFAKYAPWLKSPLLGKLALAAGAGYGGYRLGQQLQLLTPWGRQRGEEEATKQAMAQVAQVKEGVPIYKTEAEARAAYARKQIPDWLVATNATRATLGLPPFSTAEEAMAEASKPEPMTPYQQAQLDWERDKFAQELAQRQAEATPSTATPLTYEQAQEKLAQLGEGYRIDYDENLGGYRVDPDPRYQALKTPYGVSPYGEGGQWNPYTGEWEAPAGYMSAYQQKQLDLQMQQMENERGWQQQQTRAEEQRQLASLRASPASWLEYASFAGTTPSVQPWMLPLMSQQYKGTQAGAALPGWQTGGQTLAGLPQLTQPSRQYQARMGPTALAQYGGYEQARTGITPEEMQFRLGSQAPPGGRFGGLSWLR